MTKINSDSSYGWSKTFGGGGKDEGYSVAVDSSGNIYLTGYFESTVDFDPGTGTDNKTSNGSYDIFLTRINSDGSYGWTKAFGGTSDNRGYSISTDSNDNVYITGVFFGTADFDPGTGTDNKTSNGSYDIFLTKINSDGAYGWTKTFGGTGSDGGNSVATDSSGNIYVTGWFNNTVDFDPGTGTDNKTSNGILDIFVTRINADGSYGWTKTFGGTGIDEGYSVAVDSSGNTYITGWFNDIVDFNPGTGTDNKTSNGNDDIFLTRINADGSYGWTKTFGGTGGDAGFSVAVGLSGDIYLTGYFGDTVDFDPGTEFDNKTSNGSYDIFLIKMTP